MVKATQNSGDFLSVHLDEVHSPMDKRQLIKSILGLPSDTRIPIMLFASPQKIVNDKEWKKFILDILHIGLLWFVCIDEAHLFVHYGLSFRDEFAMLSTTLFSHLVLPENSSRTKIPVMFMTATCTYEMFIQLQRLSGLKFDPVYNNVF